MIKVRISAICAMLGVILGAFGAHALKDSLAARATTQVWETAVLYHLVHSVAMLSIGLSSVAEQCKWTFRLWLIGIALFSGSLYLLSLVSISFLGPITPLGGLALIAGWTALLFECRKVGK